MSEYAWRLGYFCVWALFVGYVIGCVLGCGASPGRAAVDASAHVLRTVDSIVAREYREQSIRCYDLNDTEADYRACVRPLDRIVAAESIAYHSLSALQSALDAAEDGEGSGLIAAAPCAAEAFDELIDAMRAAQVGVPAEILDAAAAFSALAPGRCVHGSD